MAGLFALLLTLCLLGSAAVPALAADAWKSVSCPFAARLKAGTPLFEDQDLTMQTGTLTKDALFVVTETAEKAAKVSFMEKNTPRTAWVDGEVLQVLDVATPTDLEELLVGQDVNLAGSELAQPEDILRFVAPGKLSSGQFPAKNGRQPRATSKNLLRNRNPNREISPLRFAPVEMTT